LKKTIYILILIILISCKSEKKETSPLVIKHQEKASKNISDDELYLNIDLQDFFKNDNTTFYINNCLIFKNQYLNSDNSVGLTGIFLRIKKEASSLTIVLNDEITIECNSKENGLVLSVFVNDVENIFTIDVKKGKYIGLDKSKNNKLILNQSLEPFEYD
jgi:hypothetical protein